MEEVRNHGIAMIRHTDCTWNNLGQTVKASLTRSSQGLPYQADQATSRKTPEEPWLN